MKKKGEKSKKGKRGKREEGRGKREEGRAVTVATAKRRKQENEKQEARSKKEEGRSKKQEAGKNDAPKGFAGKGESFVRNSLDSNENCGLARFSHGFNLIREKTALAADVAAKVFRTACGSAKKATPVVPRDKSLSTTALACEILLIVMRIAG